MLQINSDLNTEAREEVDLLPWRDSPLPGVTRKMLERTGDEVARATTVVKYAPGSSFTEHSHDKGEEFFVLEGTFSDESGDFSEDWYVRNPPGSKHAPSSSEGCTILVKLRQFHPQDNAYIRVNTKESDWKEFKNFKILPLHSFGTENTALIEVTGKTDLWDHSFSRGVEVFLIGGSLTVNGHDLQPQTWFRSPKDQRMQCSSKGCKFLIKTGHLPSISKEEKILDWSQLLGTV